MFWYNFKARETGKNLLIAQGSIVLFLKKAKVSDFGTAERFFINLLNSSKSSNCFLVWQNGSFCLIRDMFSIRNSIDVAVVGHALASELPSFQLT